MKFENEKDFENEFFKIFKDDKWLIIPLKNFNLKAVNNEIFLELKQDSNLINEEQYLELEVSEYALPSIKDRALNNAKIISKMTNEQMCSFLNLSWSLREGEGLVLIRDNKVIAVHSANYRILLQDELIAALINKSKSMGFYFSHVYYAIDLTLLSLKSCDKKEKEYRKKIATNWIKAGGSHQSLNNVTFKLMFATNDIGEQAATIYPIMQIDGEYRIIGNPIRETHDGLVTIETVVRKLDEAYSLLEKSVELVDKLIGIIVKNPIELIDRITKELKLPKKAVNKVVADFLVYYSFSSVTAYDIYLALSDTQKYQTGSVADNLCLQEKLSKLLYLDWELLDLKAGFDYNREGE